MVKPVCLPPHNLGLTGGTPLVVTGWGHLQENGSITILIYYFFCFVFIFFFILFVDIFFLTVTCSCSKLLWLFDALNVQWTSQFLFLFYLPSPGQLSSNLQKADIPLIDRTQCSSPAVYGAEITQRMLCAGYLQGKVDACQVKQVAGFTGSIPVNKCKMKMKNKCTQYTVQSEQYLPWEFVRTLNIVFC